MPQRGRSSAWISSNGVQSGDTALQDPVWSDTFDRRSHSDMTAGIDFSFEMRSVLHADITYVLVRRAFDAACPSVFCSAAVDVSFSDHIGFHSGSFMMRCCARSVVLRQCPHSVTRLLSTPHSCSAVPPTPTPTPKKWSNRSGLTAIVAGHRYSTVFASLSCLNSVAVIGTELCGLTNLTAVNDCWTSWS